MRHGLRVALLATAFALGCFALGWWSAAVIGVLWGWLVRDQVRYPTLLAGVAGIIGWSTLLGFSALTGETGLLLASMATLFGIPGFLFPAASVTIGALLAVLGTWAGAGITSGSTDMAAT